MKKNTLFTLLALLLVLGACNTSPSEDEINTASTAAVQTVEARFTQEAENIPPVPTATTEAPIEIIATAPTIAVEATAIDATTPDVCVVPEGALVASLVSENMPDLTVVKTGEYFTKSWTLEAVDIAFSKMINNLRTLTLSNAEGAANPVLSPNNTVPCPGNVVTGFTLALYNSSL
jgi:hypothetical protein